MPAWLCGLMVALALLPDSAQAQGASSFEETGRFYVQNFAPEDYGAHEQSWAVEQDQRGLVYVGNVEGVLEYDGASWRLITTANRTPGRSLARDERGRIYVGAVGELGYLAADSLGRMRYVSLIEHISEQDRDFDDVWKTYALPAGVYFQSYDRQDGQMEVWRPATRFFAGHAVHDTFYVQTTWEGELLYMAHDTLRRAPGGATFAGQRIYALVPDGADAYLVLTRSQGIFRCRSSAPAAEACARFSPGLTDLLTELQPYRATRLADGRVAIGTLRGGVVLLDRGGRLQRILNEASGLRHETVWHTYVDRQGGLWLALNDGLARVEVTAPVSYFDKTAGLAGGVNSVARHRDRLYAATSLGIYMLVPAADAAPRFVAVAGVTDQCWSLVSTRQGLLAGCSGGVYNLDQHRLIRPARSWRCIAPGGIRRGSIWGCMTGSPGWSRAPARGATPGLSTACGQPCAPSPRTTRAGSGWAPCPMASCGSRRPPRARTTRSPATRSPATRSPATRSPAALAWRTACLPDGST